jgi:hypothetical protein
MSESHDMKKVLFVGQQPETVDRSGSANLDSAISGNFGHEAGPRSAWREGVFDEEEISAAYPPHAYAGVQGPSGAGRLWRADRSTHSFDLKRRIRLLVLEFRRGCIGRP